MHGPASGGPGSSAEAPAAASDVPLLMTAGSCVRSGERAPASKTRRFSKEACCQPAAGKTHKVKTQSTSLHFHLVHVHLVHIYLVFYAKSGLLGSSTCSGEVLSELLHPGFLLARQASADGHVAAERLKELQAFAPRGLGGLARDAGLAQGACVFSIETGCKYMLNVDLYFKHGGKKKVTRRRG